MHYKHITKTLMWSQFKVSCHYLLHQKQCIKTLNRRPNTKKNIITAVSVVVMNIVIIKVRKKNTKVFHLPTPISCVIFIQMLANWSQFWCSQHKAL